MLSLEVGASSLAFMRCDNKDIIKQISQRLILYEDELKKAGLRERSSALESHARWCFLHYVQNKPYDKIAQMETYTLGGSLISYSRNVGTAVRRFSRLVDINPKTLK